MYRLIVISNRIAALSEGKGEAGGLAAGIQDMLRARGGTWIGWSGRTATRPGPARREEIGRITRIALDLPARSFAAYYRGFANGTLWPVLHHRIVLGHFEAKDWQAYLAVNERFADTVAAEGDDTVVWAHDYHLIPLAAALRRRGAGRRLGFFLHTPFPPPDIFKAVPVHRELFEQITAYDVVGFQTASDLRNFLDYATRVAGLAPPNRGRLAVGARHVKVAVYPIGIDCAAIAAQSRGRPGATQRLSRSLAGRRMMVAVDRLDYSKGLLRRFQAFGRFLETCPDQRGDVTFLQIAPTSRGDIETYRRIREELQGEAGRINGRFADLDWLPLRYLNRSFPRADLMPIYRSADVGLVTPLRDGMNLVAKEFVAAQAPEDPGVLVLSEFAGAAAELDAALQVNPYDGGAMARAMADALAMPLGERRQRHRMMMAVLERNDIGAWYTRFLHDLAAGRVA